MRVSIKSIAMGCLGSIVKLHPVAFNLSLKLEPDTEQCQTLSDVALYCNDSDPNLKAQLALVLGHYLASVYRESAFDATSITAEDIKDDDGYTNPLEDSRKWLDVMLDMLNTGDPLTIKSVLTGIGLFINEMGCEVLDVLKRLIEFKDHSYWLVKVCLFITVLINVYISLIELFIFYLFY